MDFAWIILVLVLIGLTFGLIALCDNSKERR